MVVKACVMVIVMSDGSSLSMMEGMERREDMVVIRVALVAVGVVVVVNLRRDEVNSVTALVANSRGIISCVDCELLVVGRRY
jgi:aerobic-type carbon monoxide dehydrogenase small subunit (CoxS/CutS family)